MRCFGWERFECNRRGANASCIRVRRGETLEGGEALFRSTSRHAAVLCRSIVLATAAGFCLAILVPAISQAATRYTHANSFGSLSELGQPQRIAVEQETGRLFVVDRAGARVRIYEPQPDGDLLHIGDLDQGVLVSGDLDSPSGIAIDQESKEVYVAKTGGTPAGGALLRFTRTSVDPVGYTHDASFISPTGPNWGAVVGTSINLRGGVAIARNASAQPLIFVADPGPSQNRIAVYDHAGSPAGVFPGALPFLPPSSTFTCAGCPGGPFGEIADIASNDDEAVYVADIKDDVRRLTRISRSASGRFDQVKTWDTGLTGTTLRVAVDQATGEILVADDFSYVQIESPDDDEAYFSSGPIPLPSPPQSNSAVFTTGIAVKAGGEDAGGRLYVSNARFGFVPGQFFVVISAGLQVYEADGVLAGKPLPSNIEVDEVGADEAVVSGTVQPNDESSATFRFEYVPCTAVDACAPWPPAPPSGPALQGPIQLEGGQHEVPYPVTANLAGLEPNSRYKVRLVAVNSVALSGVASEAISFVTDPAAPTVETLSAESLTDRRATLVGSVDTRNSEVEYSFVLSSEGGEIELPAEPGLLAASSGSSTVTAEALNLLPATEYEYRIKANVKGNDQLASQGETVTFETRASEETALPVRHYELVSPLRTNGRLAMPIGVSLDGDRVIWTSGSPHADSEVSFQDHRVAVRSAAGAWKATDYRAGGPLNPYITFLGEPGAARFNRTLTYAAYSGSRVEEGAANVDIYLRNVDNGEIAWVSKPEDVNLAVGGLARNNPWFLADDGSLVVFQAGSKLLPSDQSIKDTLYRWDQGEVSQVAFRPSQNALPAEQRLGPEEGSILGSGTEGRGSTTSRAVANDGRRIAFTILDSNGHLNELYVNNDGQVIEVASSGAVYQGADEEMDLVYYTRGGDLFAFEVEGDGGSQKVHPDIAGGAGVIGALAVSRHGDRVYFAATKDVTDDGVSDDVSPAGLYLAERDGNGSFELRYIGAYDSANAASNDDFGLPSPAREFGADLDGDILVFRSRKNLVPGRDTGDFPGVYAYEYEADRLYCISCPEDGSPQVHWAGVQPGDLVGTNSRAGGALSYQNETPVLVAENGSIAFVSKDQLVRDDVNQSVDTYEWRGGSVGLVSSGISSISENYGGISLDGGTIAFWSREPLVDGLPEVVRRTYAARFGPPPEDDDVVESGCVGVECRTVMQAPPRLSRQGVAGEAKERSSIGRRNCRPLARKVRLRARKAKTARRALRRMRSRQVARGRVTAKRRQLRLEGRKLRYDVKRLRACKGASRGK